MIVAARLLVAGDTVNLRGRRGLCVVTGVDASGPTVTVVAVTRKGKAVTTGFHPSTPVEVAR